MKTRKEGNIGLFLERTLAKVTTKTFSTFLRQKKSWPRNMFELKKFDYFFTNKFKKCPN